jgi:ectoine hydroxylase
LNSTLPDVITDLVGPDVTFRESLINFKWVCGGQAIRWHQDILFYPHTNLTLMQVLVALEDATPEQGPVQVIPRATCAGIRSLWVRWRLDRLYR